MDLLNRRCEHCLSRFFIGKARGSNPLFCPTEVAVNNLANEGITRGVHTVGDIMLDAPLYYRQILKDEKTVEN